jgi:IS5 family transposase
LDSVATTLDEGFVAGMCSFAGNPYDGHTLKEALEQVKILTDQRPDLAVVDRGYRDHGVEATRVMISGTRRGLTPKLIVDLRHRSAIEAKIGHMKTNGHLSRCPLKGALSATRSSPSSTLVAITSARSWPTSGFGLP